MKTKVIYIMFIFLFIIIIVYNSWNLNSFATNMKSNFEKTYSVGGVKATYSYEFNQNADPSNAYVTSLVDPIGKNVQLIKDEKGTLLGATTTMIGGDATLDSPIINELRVVITQSSDGELADLSVIGQRSTHENGHGGGPDHSWESNSGVPLDQISQESNTMNSSSKDSLYPISNGTNNSATQDQVDCNLTHLRHTQK